jgi:hypothetical protein
MEKLVDFKGNIVLEAEPAPAPDTFGGDWKINGRSSLQLFRLKPQCWGIYGTWEFFPNSEVEIIGP